MRPTDIGELVDLHYNQVGSGESATRSSDWPASMTKSAPGGPVVYDHDDVLFW